MTSRQLYHLGRIIAKAGEAIRTQKDLGEYLNYMRADVCFLIEIEQGKRWADSGVKKKR